MKVVVDHPSSNTSNTINHRFASLFLLEGVEGIQFYKVINGGREGKRDDNTLRSYVEAVCPTAAVNKDDHDSTPAPAHDDDWQALYTQFSAPHALGTVPYRWEQAENTLAILIRATLQQPLDILVVDDASLHDGTISGTQKAHWIKQQLLLDIPLNVPLMQALGRQGKAALIRETSHEWELVLPHNLLPTLAWHEAAVLRMQRHPRFPVTAKWQRCDGHDNTATKWQPWEENSPPVLPDLNTSWIATEHSNAFQNNRSNPHTTFSRA